MATISKLSGFEGFLCTKMLPRLKSPWIIPEMKQIIIQRMIRYNGGDSQVRGNTLLHCGEEMASLPDFLM